MGYRMVPVPSRSDVGEGLAAFMTFWWGCTLVSTNQNRPFDDVTVWSVLIGWAVQTTETRVACGALGRGRWQTDQRWVGEVMDVSLQMLL